MVYRVIVLTMSFIAMQHALNLLHNVTLDVLSFTDYDDAFANAIEILADCESSFRAQVGGRPKVPCR